jgi:hypothetical protein
VESLFCDVRDKHLPMFPIESMKYIPALALAVLVFIALRGVLTGAVVNFPLLLLLAVLVCGVSWAVDKFVLAKRRAAGEIAHWGIEVPASIFFVLLIVFVLRSFVAEPVPDPFQFNASRSCHWGFHFGQ